MNDRAASSSTRITDTFVWSWRAFVSFLAVFMGVDALPKPWDLVVLPGLAALVYSLTVANDSEWHFWALIVAVPLTSWLELILERRLYPEEVRAFEDARRACGNWGFLRMRHVPWMRRKT